MVCCPVIVNMKFIFICNVDYTNWKYILLDFNFNLKHSIKYLIKNINQVSNQNFFVCKNNFWISLLVEYCVHLFK